MRIKKPILVKLSFVFWLLYANVQGVQNFDDDIAISIVERGRKQLRELEEKSHLPKYGECWLHALDHLRDGCRMLTDTIQVDLALHFTNCFMEMSGQERLDCVTERTEALKRLCMSEMSDRAFAVYTEFFTQTQNMCFFLQSQRWQAQADQTIDRLSTRSKEVSEQRGWPWRSSVHRHLSRQGSRVRISPRTFFLRKGSKTEQLEVASEVQQAVLEQQRLGLKMQGEMLVLGGHLKKALNGSQEALDKLKVDLKNSTLEHQTVLKELFREFYLLHSWIVGRYAFVDRIVFYVVFLMAVMVATSTNRTNAARSYLILNVMASVLVEVNVACFFPSFDDIQKDRTQWTIRKLFVLMGSFLYGFYFYRYQDDNTRLLKEIKEQNRQIMESILRMKLESPIALKTASTHVREEQQSTLGSCLSHSQQSYRPKAQRFISPSTLVEPDTTDYEKENSSNERRSMSRSLRLTPERKKRAARTREPSRTSESSASRGSRYNLRRKT